MFLIRLRWLGPVDHTLPSTVDHTLWGYGQLRSFFEVDHTRVRTSSTLVDHTRVLMKCIKKPLFLLSFCEKEIS